MTRLLLAAALAAAATPGLAFDIASPDIAAGQPIPEAFAFDGFGCTGQNLSPALIWTDPPEGTQSFAVMVHDPDAMTGGAGFWHWALLDIAATATGLPQGTAAASALPDGARAVPNDFGLAAWGGPCPPVANGPHRYDVTVYALPVPVLEVPEGATASLAGFVVNQMALGSATLEATYDR